MLSQGFIFLLSLTVILAIDFENIDTSPMIETKFGSIVGKWTKSSLGLNIATFLGIPYAEPPIGDLRFRVSFTLNIILSFFKSN